MAGGALLSAFAWLLLTTPFNAFPEFFFLPWLVQKGLLPYRDFFDHHGPVLYYLLAPFSLDKSLVLLHVFYFLVQLSGLGLFLLILRKQTNRAGFFLGGLLYILFTYYLIGNNIWYENIITVLMLLIYYVQFFAKRRARLIVLGLLIALVSLIKPPAGLVLFAVLAYTREVEVILGFAVPWLFVLGYFALNHGLKDLLQQLFFFNLYYAKYMRGNYIQTNEKEIIILPALMVLIAAAILAAGKKLRKNFPGVLYLLASSYSLLASLTDLSLAPVVPFAILLFATSLSLIRRRIYKRAALIASSILLIFMGKKVKHRRWLRSRDIPYIKNAQGLRIVKNLKKENIAAQKFYIAGNNAEVYYLLDRLPPVKYPLVFPWIDTYFQALNQNKISAARSGVEYVYIPAGGGGNGRKIEASFAGQFLPVRESGDYILMERKHNP